MGIYRGTYSANSILSSSTMCLFDHSALFSAIKGKCNTYIKVRLEILDDENVWIHAVHKTTIGDHPDNRSEATYRFSLVSSSATMTLVSATCVCSLWTWCSKTSL